VADDPDTFADAVVALALDGAYRRKLIASGKKSVKQYAWFRLTSKVIEVCDAIGGNVQASGS
jgi:hypothetical protein